MGSDEPTKLPSIMTDEESKAVQEAAKTLAKYEPAIRELGEFFGSVVGHPLRQAGGLVGDAFGLARLELAIRYKARVDRLMHERGMNGPQRTIPLSVAYPLLEAASIEEDDDLQEMFARLLVNATDDKFVGYIPKSFVEAVRRMSPLEALILRLMVEAPNDHVAESGMLYTGGLPSVYLKKPDSRDNDRVEPASDVALALSSLVTAGCVHAMPLMNGSYMLSQAKVTEYGMALMQACTAPTAVASAQR